ncbi:MAG: hypothetical protein WB441_00890 [Nocardioidaceae bacterium]
MLGQVEIDTAVGRQQQIAAERERHHVGGRPGDVDDLRIDAMPRQNTTACGAHSIVQVTAIEPRTTAGMLAPSTPEEARQTTG